MSVKRKFDLNFAVIQDNDDIKFHSPRWIESIVDSPSIKKSSLCQEVGQVAFFTDIDASENSLVVNDECTDSMVLDDTTSSFAVAQNHNQSHISSYHHHNHYPMDSNPFAGITPQQTYTSFPSSMDTTTALWRTGFSESNYHTNNSENLNLANNFRNINDGSFDESYIQQQQQQQQQQLLLLQQPSTALLSSMYGGRTWHY